MSKITYLILVVYLFSGYSFASSLQAEPRYSNHKGIGPASVRAKHASKIVSRAHELIGTPYRWGGTSVHKGFDCSGLLVYLFRSEASIDIPRTTNSMLNSASETVGRSDLKSGDVVFFKHNGRARMKHVGVYIGGGRFIHAPRTGTSVRIDSLKNSYWRKSYYTAKRFH